MLKIGEFATITGISINMLRNYDKIGLLIPVIIFSLFYQGWAPFVI